MPESLVVCVRPERGVRFVRPPPTRGVRADIRSPKRALQARLSGGEGQLGESGAARTWGDKDLLAKCSGWRRARLKHKESGAAFERRVFPETKPRARVGEP